MGFKPKGMGPTEEKMQCGTVGRLIEDDRVSPPIWGAAKDEVTESSPIGRASIDEDTESSPIRRTAAVEVAENYHLRLVLTASCRHRSLSHGRESGLGRGKGESTDMESVRGYCGLFALSHSFRHSGTTKHTPNRELTENVLTFEQLTLHINGDFGAVDMSLGAVLNGVEATVEVAISELVSAFDLSLSCDLAMLEERGELQLFSGTIGESCGLRRFVVAVRLDTMMHLKFKVDKEDSNVVEHFCTFEAKQHGCASHQIKFELANISVKKTVLSGGHLINWGLCPEDKLETMCEKTNGNGDEEERQRFTAAVVIMLSSSGLNPAQMTPPSSFDQNLTVAILLLVAVLG
uniref:DUF6598 domain-containing protein n=1 Tax=Leersia perrieri TaxID=77586 RepID=A0A0D9V2N0_9ORYZ